MNVQIKVVAQHLVSILKGMWQYNELKMEA